MSRSAARGLNQASAALASSIEEQAAGFGQAWTTAARGAWVVRRHEITYRTPAVYGDELELTTRAVSIKGARGFRDTVITRVADAAPIAEFHTEWVWVRLPEGRPSRPPEDLVRYFSPEIPDATGMASAHSRPADRQDSPKTL